ncbi:hypothetical protein XNA1_5080020 [Xenorhabdus nematophila str. Anatoliense]|nr:hypothetical protein XNA1_5080020 [Xenorhabdus nematophila str. Anatoliense]
MTIPGIGLITASLLSSHFGENGGWDTALLSADKIHQLNAGKTVE